MWRDSFLGLEELQLEEMSLPAGKYVNIVDFNEQVWSGYTSCSWTECEKHEMQ
jgi:hypothetical protein